MASSLARQLSQVRSYNATRLGNAKDAAKAQSSSYLFPPQTAATQDYQTLQALGSNGWEELLQSDNLFGKWDQATDAGELLFGESSRSLDRLTKSQDENRKIDEAVRDFLNLTGGNLLDRSVGKCLEWLVRRFRIHEYNVDLVLSAFMPYHETPEFARMLQLVDLKDKPQYAFLLPVQKRAIPLPCPILIDALLGPPSSTASLTTFRWVVEILSPKFVTRFRRPNQPLQTFWLSTILKICTSVRTRHRSNQDDVDQQYLTILLPACVDAAITTQSGLDCQIGGNLAICALASSFTLSIEAKRSVISALASTRLDSNKIRQSLLSAMACLCIGYDWERDLNETTPLISKSNALAFILKASITTSIKSLSQTFDVSALTFCLCSTLIRLVIDDDNKDASAVLKELVQDREIVSTADAERIIAQLSGHIEGIGGEGGARGHQMLSRLWNARPDIVRSLNGAIEVTSPTKEKQSASSEKATKPSAELLLKQAESIDGNQCSVITLLSGTMNPAAELYRSTVGFSLVDPTVSSPLFTAMFARLGDASLTLLASIWTTPAQSVDVRLAALHHARAFLAAFTSGHANTRLVDFQTIFPSLLVALKDTTALIRGMAIECIEQVAAATSAIEKSGKRGAVIELYGYDTIYGSAASEPLKYLDTADVLRLTQSLLHARASFQHDAVFANSWLQSELNVAKGESKRGAAFKRRVLEMLFSHVVCWNNLDAKISILDALSSIDDATKLTILLPLIEEVVKGLKLSWLHGEQADAYVGLLFTSYDASSRAPVDSDEGGCWSVFLEALESDERLLQKHSALRLQKGLFKSLSEVKKREVYARMANLLANSMSDVTQELRASFLSLKVDYSVVVPIIQGLRDVISNMALSNTRPKKAKGAFGSLDDTAWQNAMAILVEILETFVSHKAAPSTALLAELFEQLQLGSELLLSQQSSGEYLMQVSMNNLNSLLASLSTAGRRAPLSPDMVSCLRVDTVVNVIKTPCKPQTFQGALLLLSTLGKAAPETVLHNTMPVFTFVGSTMLQRDDDYSFVVIEKTLQSILPPVLKNLVVEASDQNAHLASLQASRSLLCVFTDAAKHVPRHRRAPFFASLVSVMGSSYLAPLCMLLTDQTAAKVWKQESYDQVANTMQLPLSLFQKHGDQPRTQWKAINGIWDEVERNWIHRKDDVLELQNHVFLDCVGALGVEHEGRRVGPVKRVAALLRFIFLTFRSCAEDMEVYSHDEEDLEEQQKILWHSIEKALLMTQASESIISSCAEDILEEIMKLAPVGIVFSVIEKLLGQEGEADRRNGLHLTRNAISRLSEKERLGSSSSVARIVQTAYSILKEQQTLAVPALDAILAVGNECLPFEHIALSSGLPQLVQLAVHGNGSVQAGSLQLLRTLATHLGPRLIAHLPALVSMSLELLSNKVANQQSKELALELLTRLVRSVPVFMASHVGKVIQLFSQQSQSMPILKQWWTLLAAIVRSIATSQLLSTIFAVWEKGDKSSVSLHITCLDLLERTIKSADKKSMNLSYKTIFRQLSGFFDARRFCIIDAEKWSLNHAGLSTVEDKTVSVFLRLTLKLNESEFRPLFLRLCDWAMLDLVDEEDGQDSERGKRQSKELVSRKVVLFKVINALLEQLGELLTKYYVNVLEGVVDTLQDYAKEEVEDEDLWKQILLSLKRSAKADKDRGTFWNENRVKAIMPSLVAQLSLPIVKLSSSREDLLGDAISALCQAVPDELSVKQVNDLLLEKTRSEQTKIKISAIRVLDKIWRGKETEDMLLRLVPETVPSIAELLQEGDAAVQEEMASFVTAVEQILGEGLDNYLQ